MVKRKFTLELSDLFSAVGGSRVGPFICRVTLSEGKVQSTKLDA